MVGFFSRGFGGCRANFSRMRGSQANFGFNGAKPRSRGKFHTDSKKPKVFSNIFGQQKKTTFDNARVTVFPPYNSGVCGLLLAKLDLGGARLNSSSVSSGVGSDIGPAGEGGESALDPLISGAAIEEVLPTGMKQIQGTMMPTDSMQEFLPIEQLQAASEMLPSEIVQTTQDIIAAAEPSLASLGLCNFTPVGLVQSILDSFHLTFGMPWWASIALCTVIFRTLMLPLMVKGQINTARLNKIKPELDRIQAEMRELANTQDTMKKSLAAMQLQKLMKDHDCHPLKGLIAPLVQLPLFLSFFIALRKMATLPVESLSTGGLFWFTDLIQHDPYYILPVVTSLTMLATIELGTEMGVSNEQLKKTKNIMRFMALIMIPITAKFPAAVFTYWLTSNIYSVGQIMALKHPTVRSWVNLPEAEKSDEKQKPSGSFWQNFTAGFKNAQAQATIKYQEKEKQSKYEKQLKESDQTTYDYNPRLQEAEKVFKSGKKH